MPSYYFFHSVKFTHFFVNHNNDNDDSDDDDTKRSAADCTSAVAALINTLYDGPLASSTSSLALTTTNNKLHDDYGADSDDATTPSAALLPWQLSDRSTRTQESEFALGLPGSLPPAGQFNPLGFAKGTPLQTMLQWREAELQHGRVSGYVDCGGAD